MVEICIRIELGCKIWHLAMVKFLPEDGAKPNLPDGPGYAA